MVVLQNQSPKKIGKLKNVTTIGSLKIDWSVSRWVMHNGQVHIWWNTAFLPSATG